MKKRSDGRYQKAVTLPNGKRKLFYGRTQAEVTRKIIAFQFGQAQGPTFEQVAERWAEKHAEAVTYKTAETHAAPLRRAESFFEGRKIKDISAPDVTAFVRSVEARGLSRRTVELHLSVVRMVFDYAIGELGVVTINPCGSTTLSPGLKKGTRSLAPARDLQAIKDHRADDRFSLLPFLLLYTGLRLGEALALRREDFDLDRGVIHIRKKISWQPNQPVVDDFTKTPRGLRDVPLLRILRDELPAWDGWLFEHNGKPYTKTYFRREWRRYAERTGVSCDRHTLRHEFATLLYDAGVDTKEAAQITGHDEHVLQSIYQHLRDERQATAADKLNAYVDGRTVQSTV